MELRLKSQDRKHNKVKPTRILLAMNPVSRLEAIITIKMRNNCIRCGIQLKESVKLRNIAAMNFSIRISKMQKCISPCGSAWMIVTRLLWRITNLIIWMTFGLLSGSVKEMSSRLNWLQNRKHRDSPMEAEHRLITLLPMCATIAIEMACSSGIAGSWRNLAA